MSIRDVEEYDEDQHQHQAKKRKKLNFSIESIMQPTTSFDSNSASLSQVECQLDNKDMWDKFHSLNTEMIITKTGRRMFPVMKVQFSNLNPKAYYSVAMDIVPVDNKRYRYAYHKSCWQIAGKADPSAENRLYVHPDSRFTGDLLSRQVISFEKVKLTNNDMDKSGHIILNSMHKYQPRVYLIEWKPQPNEQQQHLSQQQAASQLHHHHQKQTSSKQASYYQQHQQSAGHNQQHAPLQPSDLEHFAGTRIFVFPETVFTAVTAYQNQLITKMKIDKNPFAKGFRDSSRLSDLDRNDPFDYMSSLSSSARFLSHHSSSMVPGSGPSALDHSLAAAAAAAAAAGSNLNSTTHSHPHPHPMDAYQLLASAAANNPWYSAAAMAAAAGGSVPFNPMIGPSSSATPPTPTSSAACSQAAQLQATQMWLAAFSAWLYGSGAHPPSSQQLQQPPSPTLPLSAHSSPRIPDRIINETSGGGDSSENSSSF